MSPGSDVDEAMLDLGSRGRSLPSSSSSRHWTELLEAPRHASRPGITAVQHGSCHSITNPGGPGHPQVVLRGPAVLRLGGQRV